jgi:hypothetical protein
MSATPFLALSRALELSPQQARETRPEQNTSPAPGADISASLESRAQLIFETAVIAVQARLNHLSRAEIRLAPPSMPDAGFARQTAVHLTIRHFGVPLKQAARDLKRSTESLHRALRCVDARMGGARFEQAYFDMAAKAERISAREMRHD